MLIIETKGPTSNWQIYIDLYFSQFTEKINWRILFQTELLGVFWINSWKLQKCVFISNQANSTVFHSFSKLNLRGSSILLTPILGKISNKPSFNAHLWFLVVKIAYTQLSNRIMLWATTGLLTLQDQKLIPGRCVCMEKHVQKWLKFEKVRLRLCDTDHLVGRGRNIESNKLNYTIRIKNAGKRTTSRGSITEGNTDIEILKKGYIRTNTYSGTPHQKVSSFLFIFEPKMAWETQRGTICTAFFETPVKSGNLVQRGCTNWCGGKIYNRKQCCHSEQRRRIALARRVVFWSLENSFKGHERRTFQGCLQQIDLWKVVLGSREVR